ncbi:MAG: hypothetical protein LBP51_04235 [Deferribacteraceae bacterium]|jgi:predicted hotdog family 3-hydroxylacyl-ACP dehydratase|nr:hypothetical protein [Deferribacteraceae bacterium]
MKNLKYTDMAELLPHKPPMIFIDGVAEYDLNLRTAAAYFTVSKESHFFDPSAGGAPSWTGIEYMAQAIGVLAGINALENGRAPTLAFLLGARLYEAHVDFFLLNRRYDVHVSENFAELELGNYRCAIYNDGFLCAEADMSTYLPTDIQRIYNL